MATTINFVRQSEMIAWYENQTIIPRVGEIITLGKWPETRYRVTAVWHWYSSSRNDEDPGVTINLEILPKFQQG